MMDIIEEVLTLKELLSKEDIIIKVHECEKMLKKNKEKKQVMIVKTYRKIIALQRKAMQCLEQTHMGYLIL